VTPSVNIQRCPFTGCEGIWGEWSYSSTHS